MRICLHIGLMHAGAERLQEVLSAKRAALRARGVLVPKSPGAPNHSRLYMAVTDPDHIDPLRFNRGTITAARQEALRAELREELAADIGEHQPEVMILSCPELGTGLSRQSELERLRDLLAPLAEEIRIVAHVDAQARVLAAQYGAQILEGRAAPLSRDLALVGAADWFQAALATRPEIAPMRGLFEETQAAPFWLDYRGVQRFWEGVFGADCFSYRSYDPALFQGERVTREVCEAFGIEGQIGKIAAAAPAPPLSAASLARGRQFNALLLRLLERDAHVVPRKLWRQMVQEMAIDGPALRPEDLEQVTAYFAADNAALCAAHPGLDPRCFETARASESGGSGGDWQEADPEFGFRASQYLLAGLHRIETATREERAAREGALGGRAGTGAAHRGPGQAEPSARARRLLPAAALEKFDSLQGSPYQPHNRIGSVDEEAELPPYSEVPPRRLPKGQSGTLIIGCMKNEAPYILEWIAYHRMIGVDSFLIYSNDCSDGTAEILNRLQEMGVIAHRNNDGWKGKSPQQYALNQARREPLTKAADWLIHIDVDEFINVRCGNGRLEDFLDRVPEASAVAMTWRLFGHGGVRRLADQPVIAQFERCAPQYCPKPHTVWGFKTMFRNSGAYKALSCHRPNKLDPDRRDGVRWVNGSGADMTAEAAEKGWRNSRSSIGYDLLQLNHYALRSAESFLVKRQRGRALHVDRSIGLNYWIRMDWNDHRDVTIQRNLPRLRAEMARLLEDPELRRLHHAGMQWHLEKAEELHKLPEFEELYSQALEIDLTATERVAWALSLDLES